MPQATGTPAPADSPAADSTAPVPPAEPGLLAELAEAALSVAAAGGCTDAELRAACVRTGLVEVHDGRLAVSTDEGERGIAVRVLWHGRRGVAATSDRTPDGVAAAARRAVELARRCAAAGMPAVSPVPEPAYPGAVWRGGHEIDPLAVPAAERAEVLAEWSAGLLQAGVERVRARLHAVRERTFLATLTGSAITQERVRVHPLVFASVRHPRSGELVTARSLGPPSARGFEYLLGRGWDFDGELARLPEQLAATVQAPAVDSGPTDLVIAPSNLWLTLHETVGHATEADRVRGEEAAFAGTTFVRATDLGVLRYGSPRMNIVADRTREHGLATAAYDDEGVATGAWPLVEMGVLTGLQTDRAGAAALGEARSRGCAYAQHPRDVPLSRMPNVSLVPDPAGPTLDELIGSVRRGLYVDGSDSWSIDMQRRQFQFTGQRFHRIVDGRLAGQVRHAAYHGTTLRFWRALAAVGGPSTYAVYGADLCGKGQPVQMAAVSHGAPATLFRAVPVSRTGAS